MEKLEIRNWKLETENSGFEIRNSRFEISALLNSGNHFAMVRYDMSEFFSPTTTYL